MIKSNNCFRRHKILSLVGFSLLYNMIYIGRFNLNYLLTKNELEIAMLPYQIQLISASVFFAYAIGSIVNGALADRWNPQKMVLIGTGMSILMNLGVALVQPWYLLLLFWFVNGYFQSMIWVSGINIIVHWWKSDEWGIGCGVANFFSGLSHVTAYALPMVLLTLFPEIGWKGQFVLPMFFVFIFLLLFAAIVKASPENIGCPPYIDGDTSAVENEKYLLSLEEKGVGNQRIKYFLGKGLMIWSTIAFLSSLCRYGLLKWIPIYYEAENFSAIMNSTFIDLILPLGMAVGTLLITWMAGGLFRKNKGLVVIIAAASCGTIITIFPVVHDTVIILSGIFFTGFFLYGVNGVLWVYAMEAGGRLRAGTIAGILNGCAYLGATLEAVLFPLIIRWSGTLISVYVTMEVLCIFMVACGIAVSNKNTVVEQIMYER